MLNGGKVSAGQPLITVTNSRLCFEQMTTVKQTVLVREMEVEEVSKYKEYQISYTYMHIHVHVMYMCVHVMYMYVHGISMYTERERERERMKEREGEGGEEGEERRRQTNLYEIFFSRESQPVHCISAMI